MNNKRPYETTSIDDEDIGTKKVRHSASITISRNKCDNTHFEDLSNDLITEIFIYLDGFHIYQSFSSLNIRFQNLVASRTISLQIDGSSISKSSFENSYIDFIQLHKNRIQSLYLSNPCIIDTILSSIKHFSQLQTLIIDQIECERLEHLLTTLTCLQYLSFLSINIEPNANKTEIYNQIFMLSTLKSCKISCEDPIQLGQFLFSTNISCSIEILLISGQCYLNELDSSLSHLPQLRHLYVKQINGDSNSSTELSSPVINHLTYVSIKLDSIKFVQFEQFVKKYFQQVKQLFISTTRDMTYLEGNRWEKLIITSMSHLQIFDFHHTIKNFFDYPDDIFENLFNQFHSQFWKQQQWFFEYVPNTGEYQQGMFHSIQPYRKKYLSLGHNPDVVEKTGSMVTLYSVRHVIIQDHQAIITCSKSFPNINELTLVDQCSLQSKRFLSNEFHDIISLSQLTKLNININHLYFSDFVQILQSTPNVHILTLKSLQFFTKCGSSIQTFDNKIRKITITDHYSLRTMKILIEICPNIQHLTIGIFRESVLPTVRYLLSNQRKTLSNNLFSLYITGMNTMWTEKIQNFIESDKLLDKYVTKVIGHNFYLWW
ncbi:hypothetical protein I4U23_020067 [Adineta vaga]|nr:hypothetical protein I4U23_020067 [Adineta vaga]